MIQFEIAVAETMRREGYEDNDPADAGGHTRFGITKALAIESGVWTADKDFSLFTIDDAKLVYYKMKYLPMRIHLIKDEVIGLKIFDLATLFGNMVVAKNVQRSLNRIVDKKLKVDGLMGMITADAINSLDEHQKEEFMEMLMNRQGVRVDIITKKRERKYTLEEARKFRRGWLRRVRM